MRSGSESAISALLLACLLGGCANTQSTQAGSATALTPESASDADPLAALRFLVGHCWTGTFPDGRRTDTHCYEALYGNAFVRDRHEVEGGAGIYRGETLYHFDAENDLIVYRYYNSLGGVSDGVGVAEGPRIVFPGERHVQKDGTVLEIRSVIENAGDSYVSITEKAGNDDWTEMWRIEFEQAQ